MFDCIKKTTILRRLPVIVVLDQNKNESLLISKDRQSSKSRNLYAGTFNTLAMSNSVSRDIALLIFGAST